MCFMDRTFCASPNCTGKCGRQWTAELQEKAKKWWGALEGSPPIAFAHFCKETV